MIGYRQYLLNAIEIMTYNQYHTITELNKIKPGSDKILLLMLQVAIEDIQSKKFLRYFLQHQERLELEQQQELIQLEKLKKN